MRGADAQELAEKLPGLITVQGEDQVAVAGSAREFPHLQEKVRCRQQLLAGSPA